jgi:hypothetical protein
MARSASARREPTRRRRRSPGVLRPAQHRSAGGLRRASPRETGGRTRRGERWTSRSGGDPRWVVAAMVGSTDRCSCRECCSGTALLASGPVPRLVPSRGRLVARARGACTQARSTRAPGGRRTAASSRAVGSEVQRVCIAALGRARAADRAVGVERQRVRRWDGQRFLRGRMCRSGALARVLRLPGTSRVTRRDHARAARHSSSERAAWERRYERCPGELYAGENWALHAHAFRDVVLSRDAAPGRRERSSPDVRFIASVTMPSRMPSWRARLARKGCGPVPRPGGPSAEDQDTTLARTQPWRRVVPGRAFCDGRARRMQAGAGRASAPGMSRANARRASGWTTTMPLRGTRLHV